MSNKTYNQNAFQENLEEHHMIIKEIQTINNRLFNIEKNIIDIKTVLNNIDNTLSNTNTNINNINNSCKNMDNHIGFVENVYNVVKNPIQSALSYYYKDTPQLSEIKKIVSTDTNIT